MAKTIVHQDTFDQDVRTTGDGKKSILDLFARQGVSNPSQCLKRLHSQYPEVLTLCYDWKFPGARQRKTPVVDRNGWFQILGLLPTVAGVKYRKTAATVMGKLQDGDAELGAELIIRDHNKSRVERAKKRLLVSDTNKETMELAKIDGARYADVHNDRYRGLYQKNASQLREDAGLEKSQTPLDKMSAYDLNLNSLANQMAILAGNSGAVGGIATGLRQLHQQTVGRPLCPTWEAAMLRPSQAQRIAYSPEYQVELPV